MEWEEGWGNKHKTNTDTDAEAKVAEGKGKRQLEKERIPDREQPSGSIFLLLMLATKLKNLCTSGVTVPYAALQPQVEISVNFVRFFWHVNVCVHAA